MHPQDSELISRTNHNNGIHFKKSNIIRPYKSKNAIFTLVRHLLFLCLQIGMKCNHLMVKYHFSKAAEFTSRLFKRENTEPVMFFSVCIFFVIIRRCWRVEKKTTLASSSCALAETLDFH